MYSIIVTNVLYPNSADEYLHAMCENARASVASEEGCLRFDVLRDQSGSDSFHLYEIYTDAAALALHKQTDHYKTCRQVIEKLVKRQSVIRGDLVAINPDNRG